ncbi:unnamed protein product [Closterium sp. Yama58-4]|nr:unnamed protein product [Closterium sp. Yama58-4]
MPLHDSFPSPCIPSADSFLPTLFRFSPAPSLPAVHTRALSISRNPFFPRSPPCSRRYSRGDSPGSGPTTPGNSTSKIHALLSTNRSGSGSSRTSGSFPKRHVSTGAAGNRNDAPLQAADAGVNADGVRVQLFPDGDCAGGRAEGCAGGGAEGWADFSAWESGNGRGFNGEGAKENGRGVSAVMKPPSPRFHAQHSPRPRPPSPRSASPRAAQPNSLQMGVRRLPSPAVGPPALREDPHGRARSLGVGAGGGGGGGNGVTTLSPRPRGSSLLAPPLDVSTLKPGGFHSNDLSSPRQIDGSGYVTPPQHDVIDWDSASGGSGGIPFGEENLVAAAAAAATTVAAANAGDDIPCNAYYGARGAATAANGYVPAPTTLPARRPSFGASHNGSFGATKHLQQPQQPQQQQQPHETHEHAQQQRIHRSISLGADALAAADWLRSPAGASRRGSASPSAVHPLPPPRTTTIGATGASAAAGDQRAEALRGGARGQAAEDGYEEALAEGTADVLRSRVRRAYNADDSNDGDDGPVVMTCRLFPRRSTSRTSLNGGGSSGDSVSGGSVREGKDDKHSRKPKRSISWGGWMKAGGSGGGREAEKGGEVAAKAGVVGTFGGTIDKEGEKSAYKPDSQQKPVLNGRSEEVLNAYKALTQQSAAWNQLKAGNDVTPGAADVTVPPTPAPGPAAAEAAALAEASARACRLALAAESEAAVSFSQAVSFAGSVSTSQQCGSHTHSHSRKHSPTVNFGWPLKHDEVRRESKKKIRAKKERAGEGPGGERRGEEGRKGESGGREKGEERRASQGKEEREVSQEEERGKQERWQQKEQEERKVEIEEEEERKQEQRERGQGGNQQEDGQRAAEAAKEAAEAARRAATRFSAAAAVAAAKGARLEAVEIAVRAARAAVEQGALEGANVATLVGHYNSLLRLQEQMERQERGEMKERMEEEEVEENDANRKGGKIQNGESGLGESLSATWHRNRLHALDAPTNGAPTELGSPEETSLDSSSLDQLYPVDHMQPSTAYQLASDDSTAGIASRELTQGKVAGSSPDGANLVAMEEEDERMAVGKTQEEALYRQQQEQQQEEREGGGAGSELLPVRDTCVFDAARGQFVLVEQATRTPGFRFAAADAWRPATGMRRRTGDCRFAVDDTCAIVHAGGCDDGDPRTRDECDWNGGSFTIARGGAIEAEIDGATVQDPVWPCAPFPRCLFSAAACAHTVIAEDVASPQQHSQAAPLHVATAAVASASDAAFSSAAASAAEKRAAAFRKSRGEWSTSGALHARSLGSFFPGGEEAVGENGAAGSGSGSGSGGGAGSVFSGGGQAWVKQHEGVGGGEAGSTGNGGKGGMKSAEGAGDGMKARAQVGSGMAGMAKDGEGQSQADQSGGPGSAANGGGSGSEFKRTMGGVTRFGAQTNGWGDSSLAFRRAFAAACGYGARTRQRAMVHVPGNAVFRIFPMEIQGPCGAGLIVRIDGAIQAFFNTAAYPRPESSHTWAMLGFDGIDNLVVAGSGYLDGAGRAWWGQGKRPMLMHFADCRNLLISGITYRNPGKIHLKVKTSMGVMIRGVRTLAPWNSPNTDSISISSSSNVVVKDSRLESGDDGVAIVGMTRNVLVENITCINGHGISIGSLGAEGALGCIQGITIRDVTFRGSNNGLRIKTYQGGVGMVSNVSYDNVQMTDVTYPIVINQFYCDTKNVDASKCVPQENAVAIQDISYNNIRASCNGTDGITVGCSSTVPCRDITLTNVRIVPSDPGKTLTPSYSNAYGSSGNVLPLPMGPLYSLKAGFPGSAGRLSFSSIASQCHSGVWTRYEQELKQQRSVRVGGVRNSRGLRRD